MNIECRKGSNSHIFTQTSIINAVQKLQNSPLPIFLHIFYISPVGNKYYMEQPISDEDWISKTIGKLLSFTLYINYWWPRIFSFGNDFSPKKKEPPSLLWVLFSHSPHISWVGNKIYNPWLALVVYFIYWGSPVDD